MVEYSMLPEPITPRNLRRSKILVKLATIFRRGAWAGRFFSIGFAGLMLTGCVSQRQILFGIYAVPIGQLGEARELGVDFVVGPGDAKYREAAGRAELKLVQYGPQFVTDAMVLGNYLTDEPDLRDIPPTRIEAEYKAAKRRSSKPVILNLSSGYSIEAYGRFCDIPMFDWYPVGWQPLETYYANLRIARLAAGRKPFYAVVQAFDWSRYPTLMPPSAAYRWPTGDEVKAMTLWAAMNGAAGIAFYPFDDGHTRLSEAPELRTAMQEAMRTVRENASYFLTERGWAPYPFRFQTLSDKDNAIAETSIGIRWSRNPDKPGELLLVAANTTDRPINVTVLPAFRFSEAGPALSFAPLEVKLLRAVFTPPTKAKP